MPLREQPDKPESATEQNDRILRRAGPGGFAFSGRAQFLHPNDVVRVAEKLNALDATFDNDEHSAGSVAVLDAKVNWKIVPITQSERRIIISLDKF